MEKSDGREPTSQERAVWEANRPQHPRIADPPTPEPLPTVHEAAAILLSFRNPLGSSASSFTPPTASSSSSSSSSSYPRSTEPPPSYFESRYPSLSFESNEVSLEVVSSVSPKRTRPGSLYVDIEPTVDQYDALSDPGYTDSTGSLYSPLVPITPLLVSFFGPVVSSAPRRNDDTKGESAYPQW
jgi:hypothetical protein